MAVRSKGQSVYEIRVRGKLDESWSEWLSGMAVTVENDPNDPEGVAPITLLIGAVADQAALRGILQRLWDLNLTLISVGRLSLDG